MSTQKQTYVGISVRLKELVEEHAPGSAKKFADSVGIGSVTFYNYLNGRIPPANVLANICERYRVNLNWLVLDIGSKYITDQGEGHLLDPDPEISELMEGARRVLTSGDQDGIKTLEQCIKHLERTIEKEKKQQEEIEAIKKELAESRKGKCKDGKHCQGEQLPNEKAA